MQEGHTVVAPKIVFYQETNSAFHPLILTFLIAISSWLSTVLMVSYLMTCIVILLNILIAQLSDTYNNIKIDAQRALELNRASIVTRVELNSIFAGKV